MKERKERDTLGEVAVRADRYWGAQTQRSVQNFAIGHETMPIEVIRALAYVKKAAAMVNCDLELLPEQKKELISQVCDEILSGKLDIHFPLSVWQTGSGTQTNMNVNEVISNRAIELAGGNMGSKEPIHPNDDVNMSQSSNDVFPSAMHVAAMLLIQQKLLPALNTLQRGFAQKADEFDEIIKVGRTHLMDAAPLTLGQEFSGYAAQVKQAIEAIEAQMEPMSELAIGGTAVGTGVNAPPGFGEKAAAVISQLTGLLFTSAVNKFAALAAHDAIVGLSGSLRQTAVAFMKIANDIRWMGSGPRSGLSELFLPENEPGSSIMPGKINPTQSESMTMVAVQVMGNDTVIAFAGSLGNFELNVFKPVMIYNLIQSIHLLAGVALNFQEKCLSGLRPNLKQLQKNVHHSLMPATALNGVIGYDKAAQVVKKAYAEDLSLKEAAVKLGFLTPEKFDAAVDVKKMIGSDQ
ncbi:MAG: class II fumarate hydratase [Verrucomicrobiota bacterium]|nr:class II fumarate hydratase [Verrucomicrobiota bacterium]